MKVETITLLRIPDGEIEIPDELVTVTSSAVAATLLRHLVRQWETEEFWALYLSARADVLWVRQMGRGEEHRVVVNPRELLVPILEHDCDALLLGHSHTTSPIVPSIEDRAATWQIYGAAELLGSRLVDHVIVSRTAHFSFMDEKLLS